jgi:hypothetical protein
VLDDGRVFIEVPPLMTDEELAVIFERLIADARGRAPKAPADPPKEQPKSIASVSVEKTQVTLK